ncbi:ROK family protein [Phycisphaerales bacterium AB-hyl4]|uniref:ROK family protein n=1 Tax=Natronomicrosphaera hydrolytica TaxID=3242702 RepID=A0ABV4U3R1_9BACT
MEAYSCLGLDIGGTKCAAVVGGSDGRVIDRVEWPSRAERGPEAMMADLVRQGQSLLARCGGVQGVGVSIGGPLDAERGVVHGPPNLPGWDAVPLAARLREAFGLPVRVEHDGSACALAEYRWGAGRGAERLAYLTSGTGFGVGLIFDGLIYRGAGGRPSDFGHVRYRPSGPIAYGAAGSPTAKAGCFEAYCAASALGALAAWRYPDRWPAAPAPSDVAALAAAGDEAACSIVNMTSEATGAACALLADLLHLDVILLGSLARYLGQAWVERVRAAFLAEAHPLARENCRIDAAGLGNRLQDCSALAVACIALE